MRTLRDGTENGRIAFQLFLIYFSHISELKAQARRAVRQRRDVIGAAQAFNDVCGSVLDRCHFILLA